ncbi:hypothetical protein [Ruegeria lacuscaerulensis]|uniref:hypothetical protein n=1 Tax=Ruegeria lacuscaerulensis TaxID=55218 RepID=UPI00147D973E|nr:hypothetical protein [Ruegeria lacuscaerulensis]
MKRKIGTLQKAFCIVSFSLLLACGAPTPEILLSNMANRSTVNLFVQIDGDRGVDSATYTRGEGAASGIGAGAAGALEGGLSSHDPFGVVLGVVLVPVFATAGGIYGASTGTSRSREEILSAAYTINQAYRPERFESAFEAMLSNSLQTALFDGVSPCFSSRSSRGDCPQGARASNLRIRTTFHLVPADTGAGSGNLDFLGRAKMIAEPAGVLQPQCILLEYRSLAGNLFKLAENNGRSLASAFQSTLNDFATELPQVLRSEEANGAKSSWKQLECSEWEFQLQ